MTNEQIVRDACRIVWAEGDHSRISEFYADNYTADYPFTDWGKGLEGIKALADGQRVAFPDYSENVDELYDAGDDIIVVLTITGTHKGTIGNIPATGKKFQFRDVTICHIENGKIARQSGLSDHLSFFLQTGLLELPGSTG